MTRLLELRNVSQWTDLPLDVVAALTPAEYDDLKQGVAAQEDWAVQWRKRT